MNVREIGLRGEEEFIRRLNIEGIPYEYKNDWYDFEIYKEKVEVKTCRLSIKNKHKTSKYRVGRFDFTDKENREKQSKENIWICFLIREKDEYILLGFCKAKKLEKRRYISIHKTRELGLISIEEWKKRLRRDENGKKESN